MLEDPSTYSLRTSILYDTMTLNMALLQVDAVVHLVDGMNIVATLGQMVNLFELEGLMAVSDFSDLQFVIERLGNQFVFHGDQPKSKNQVMGTFNYVAGLTGSNLSITSSDHRVQRSRYTASNAPLMRLAKVRSNISGLSHVDRGALDLELVIYADKLQRLDKKDVKTVQFSDATGKCIIDNRYELEKLKDKSPDLSNLETMELIADVLEKERSLCMFDWLAMEKAQTALITNLEKALQEVDTTCTPATSITTMQRVRRVVFHIVRYADETSVSYLGEKHKKRLGAAFKVFCDWSKDNGSVGSAGLARNFGMAMPSLSDAVVGQIKEIVKTRGLRENLFSEEMMRSMDLTSTFNLEEEVKEKWRTFRR